MQDARTLLEREAIKGNLAGVKHIIAIISGKGGVGKSTVAVNLAAFLGKHKRVGLLDADIDCPNINKMLGITERLKTKDGRIVPVKSYGMNVVSMASFQEAEDEPIIWRGPMLTNMLIQFLGQVEFGSLDYLVIDLPPGTSDIPLTIMQFLDLDGLVVVTTPQQAATIDAKKAANMARKLNAPLLGIIENMAGPIFGAGGGERAAKELGIDFLGRLELDANISKSAEFGKPFVLDGCKQNLVIEEVAHKIRRKIER